MALNAGIGGGHGIEVRRAKDVRTRRMYYVFAARAVATFATYVPLRDLLGVDVVAYRVTPIASRARTTLHIVVGVEGCPPVSSFRDFVGAPGFVRDIPLRG